mgnify:FL=1
MICPHCGSVIPDNSAFCAQCGARLAEPQQDGAPAAEPAKAQAPGTEANARAAEIAESVPPVDAPAATAEPAAGAGETQLMPEGAAGASSSPSPEQVPEIDKTMVYPGAFAAYRDSAAAEKELAQLPCIDEPPADMPPAIPIEGTPVAEPEPDISDFLPKQPAVSEVPEASDVPEVPGVPEVPAAPERTEQRMSEPECIVQRNAPAAAHPEPFQTISPSAGATPLLKVPVNSHDTSDYRNSVKRRRHARAEAQQSHPVAQTVSRAVYESRIQDESYTEAVSEASDAASQRSSSAFGSEEGQSLEEHARRAESALSGGVHVAERRRSKGPIIVAICLICAVAAAGYLIYQNMQAAETTADTETTEAAATDTEAAAPEPAVTSPVTASDEVSYNSDTGLLTMENYGFSVTVPTGITAAVSWEG